MILLRNGVALSAVGLAGILGTRFSHAAPLGLAERVASGALSAADIAGAAAAAVADGAAPGAFSNASNELAQSVAARFSLLRVRTVMCWAASFAIVCGACGVLVHRYITAPQHDQREPTVRVEEPDAARR